MDGTRMASPEDVATVLRGHKPGDNIAVTFADRTGLAKTTTVTLREDPRVELVPVEATGAKLMPEQKTFRDRWLR